MFTIDDLADRLGGYLPPDEIQQVKRAFYYAEQAHDGQRRRSGEPYVTHPLAVANILANMHMDHQSLMAAMLHDVIEDTGVSKKSPGCPVRQARGRAGGWRLQTDPNHF